MLKKRPCRAGSHCTPLSHSLRDSLVQWPPNQGLRWIRHFVEEQKKGGLVDDWWTMDLLAPLLWVKEQE
ncbi:hypothetical protein PAHAL_8G042200 [Panicum hallii]|uniref:Uncharacterized protein n=1 Tax=Panicum hallii TaxID=206008 RepID=A0A2T8I7L6_9POAL|nr:hypothetical protein PAHAL_8G042200 [Panicum hallii]